VVPVRMAGEAVTTSLHDDASRNGHGSKVGWRPRADDATARRDRLPVARRPRRPVAIAAGVLVLAASSALGGALALRGDKAAAVLTLARPVTAGQTLAANDLAVAHLSGSGVHGIAASYANALVGETAQANLPAGTLLTAQMVSPSSVPGTGQQVVAVAMKPGAFPPELLAGRAVSVLEVSPANGGSGLAPTVLVPSARVLNLRADPSTGVTVVSLVVDASRALAVAQASASGGVSLSLLPVGR
jgi:hypothetical protein